MSLVDNWGSDDKLNRKDSADFLSNYLTKRYAIASQTQQADTFVLNIRADWGVGKSFFLQRWARDLQENYPVVFFDAWANDFSDDPLIGFIAEISDSLSGRFRSVPAVKRHVDGAIAVGRKLIKPIGFAIASAVTKQLVGCGVEKLGELYATESGEAGTAGNDEGGAGGEIDSLISSCADIALKEHVGKKETIAVFKKRLGRLVEALQQEPGVQLPLFIFIDELDRCRPTYAIELLEAVKHLFGVPGIYFIVATNLEQLSHSVRAVYGEKFDSERYLKRFFDQEYVLPAPDSARFTAFLFEKHSLDKLGDLYSVIEDGIYSGVPPEQALFTIFCGGFGLSLRDQEQVAGALQAVLLNWPRGERVHFAYLLFLVIAKQRSASLFQQLSENRLQDVNTFNGAINKFIIPGAVFQTKEPGESGRGLEIREHPLLNLLWAYHSIKGRSLDEMVRKDHNMYRFPEKIFSVIARDAPREYVIGVNSPAPISNYVGRVGQAGQLIVP